MNKQVPWILEETEDGTIVNFPLPMLVVINEPIEKIDEDLVKKAVIMTHASNLSQLQSLYENSVSSNLNNPRTEQTYQNSRNFLEANFWEIIRFFIDPKKETLEIAQINKELKNYRETM